jgi:urease accessory protein
VTLLGTLLAVTPAVAHHAEDGKVSTNFIEGFLFGLAHPIIGVDHLAFIIAVGLLAASLRLGFWIPVAFVLSALIGTGAHLQSVNLPAPEFFIAASVLVFGSILAMKHYPNLVVMLILAALAGLFHGYAYGEAIVGATMVPMLAYLLGFTIIQLAISMLVYQMGRTILKQASEQPVQAFRCAGFTLLGIGIAFMTSQFTG